MDPAQSHQLDLDLDSGLYLDHITINLNDAGLNYGGAIGGDRLVLDPAVFAANSDPAITVNSGWNGNIAPSWTWQDLSITSPPQAKISLKGDDADIEINGESVVGMLKDIRDRLNILQVSEEMESEWDELRDLREQYEAKLAECREKSRAWKALQQAG